MSLGKMQAKPMQAGKFKSENPAKRFTIISDTSIHNIIYLP